ncbi:MAG: calcium/sodium antiporter [Candidatus Marinimicrobia bacterium]|nr:calcium/sodium antiporter [Candidatus Neomarinimicrobiota bacterium]
MILLLSMLVVGGVMLYLGAEGLVWGGMRLALRLRVAPLVIGLTVVAFGTSLPEFTVSLYAVMQEAEGIAVGNVVGSNIANVSLILATSAIVFPVAVNFRAVRADLLILIGLTVVFIALCLDGELSRLDGALLTAGIIAYLWRLAKSPTIAPDVSAAKPTQSVQRMLLAVVAGLAILALGTHLFIGAAVELARMFGLSELVIGATIVAVGTSLPELATSMVAALHKQTEIVLGNILGSNVFNMIAVLGIIPLFKPIPVPAQAITFHMPVMLGLTVVLLPLLRFGGGIRRSAGWALLAVYVAFIVGTLVVDQG